MDEHTMRTLTAMARALYPHDFLEDALYRKVVEHIVTIEAIAPDALSGGVASLDRAAGARFADLAESAQVAALKSIEQSAFFEAMRAATVRHLYNDPEVWRHFGYEGPSAHLGGYVKRGFDDISWIPDE